jgi:ankyrin repeat protein
MKKIIGLLLVLVGVCSLNCFAASLKEPFATIKDGDLSQLKVLLKTKPGLMKALSRRKRFPIHFAAIQGKIEMVKYFLDQGVSPNIRDKSSISGDSPAYCALVHKNFEIAKLLFKRGAHTYERNDSGSLLVLAANKNNLDMVKFLVEKGVNINLYQDKTRRTALINAVRENNFAMASYLIKKGARVNHMADRNTTALHVACRKGYFDIAKLLIENKASLNIQELESMDNVSAYASKINRRFGDTPLHCAVKNKHTEIVELLLSNGAKTEHRSYGYTPMHCAAKYGNAASIRLLKKHGAKLNVKDKYDNKTPLSMAISKRRKKIIQVLKSLGATK